MNRSISGRGAAPSSRVSAAPRRDFARAQPMCESAKIRLCAPTYPELASGYPRSMTSQLEKTMTKVARQFLRALRGRRSQQAFARRLGFKGNPIADWEAGRRMPTAEVVLRACERVGVDVAGAFARFHPALALTRPEQVAAWLAAARGSVSFVELAARSGYSRYQIARWLQARAKPRLPEFLTLVEAITGRVSDLLAELVPMREIPALAPIHAQREAARRLAYEEPWTEAILRVLETDQYRGLSEHVPGYIAATLDIDRATEERCLAKLERSGIVRRIGERYACVGSLTVDTRAVPMLKLHWNDAVRGRIAAPLSDDLFAYNVFSVSAADLQRIRELLLAAFRQARSIVAATPSNERIAVVNLQLMCWPEPKRDHIPIVPRG